MTSEGSGYPLPNHHQGQRHYFQSGGADFFFLYKSHGLGVGGGCATFHTCAEAQKML